MSKRFTKIICLMFSVVVAIGAALIAGCSGVYKANPLSKSKGEIFTSDKAVSNGGFAVEKENYVYFINGYQTYTADNSYGTPVKGAIYRIAKTDLAARNYSSVDCVVPLVVYSDNQDGGIFVYGDYIYYSTPSTGKTASGMVENSKLDLKRTKLDGTETMKDAFVQFENNNTEFRFVEVDNTVYILYVAKSETLYDEDEGVTNLHSYNTKTGANTLLAYNVDAVQFDDENKTNPRVYYTMGVYDYAADEDFGYNQIYTVNADATTPNEYDFTTVNGWNEDEDKGTVDRYVNCGTLVFDGIGLTDYLKNQNSGTPFNYDPTGAVRNNLSYTYTLRAYTNDTVFYTRSTDGTDNYLFSFNEDDVLATGWNPVENNAQSGLDSEDRDDRILNNGSSSADYTYIFEDGKFVAALIADDNGIAINKVDEDGKLQKGPVGSDKYFYVAEGESAKVLFTEVNGSHKYLYYSVSASGNNGDTINRVDYSGNESDYGGSLQLVKTEYDPVRVLDLDACSDWYLPELIEGQILFASETDKMTGFNYVMACDIRSGDSVMTNAEIRELNEKYEGINDVFDDLNDTDNYPASDYANLVSALKYAHFVGEDWNVYLKGLAAACNAELEKDDDRVYSDATHEMYEEFMKPEAGGVWEEYQDSVKVNGKDVYANRRDYYYSVIGKMTSSDIDSYVNSYRTEYLVDYPEDNSTWWENINTAAKVCFIIGMCAIGILVIGGGVVLALVLIKRKNKKMPEFKKKKIKVDTTDDKNIDVYADGEGAAQNAEPAEDDAEPADTEKDGGSNGEQE